MSFSVVIAVVSSRLGWKQFKWVDLMELVADVYFGLE